MDGVRARLFLPGGSRNADDCRRDGDVSREGLNDPTWRVPDVENYGVGPFREKKRDKGAKAQPVLIRAQGDQGGPEPLGVTLPLEDAGRSREIANST